MKKGYESPIIYVERFEPNEYCVTCDTVDVLLKFDCLPAGRTVRLNGRFLNSTDTGAGSSDGTITLIPQEDGSYIEDGSTGGSIYRSGLDLDNDGSKDLVYLGPIAENHTGTAVTGCHNYNNSPGDGTIHCEHSDIPSAHHHISSMTILHDHS